MTVLAEIEDFLGCPTPDLWLQNALANPEILLIDHANCEKKAASTAMNLMYRYVSDFDLLHKMSRLAREELRHFEQVLALMQSRDIDYIHLTASRYAGGMRKGVRSHDPVKLVDTLIVGAFIEARSCERFAKLAPLLDDELKAFYMSLLKSEGRHYRDYLALAKSAADNADIEDRISFFRQAEMELVEEPDTEFRFHSGPMSA
ncbi:MAG: tRNA isopentenyl-2-thiomethyl-A-37 hydroxylase MiaE [Pseudomonadales bacterium]